MTPELTDALQQFVSVMINLVNEGINTGIDQLPLVLQDIVGAAVLAATISWWAGLTAIGLGCLMIGYEFLFGEEGIIGCFGLLGGVIGGGLWLVASWYQYYYVTMFPRLVVLDYLKALL